MGQGENITKTQAAKAQLARQQQLLDMAGRVARFGGWFVDLESKQIEWSDEVAKIHAMPHGYSPKLDEGIAFYAPEYRDRIRELFTACVERGVPYDEELQIIDANGRHVWVRTLGEPVRDEHGRIVHAQGAFQDVTYRHEHEAELRASRDELAALLASRKTLINSLPAYIAMLDVEGTIIEVNDQWRCFGANNAYSGENFGLGMNYIRLCETASGESANEAPAVAAGLRAVLDGEQDSFRLEYPCHSPQEFRWFRVTANRLGPDSGDGTRHGAVVMHVDITEYKRATQQLERIAFEDLLTGLCTRNGFVQRLHLWIEKNGWPASGAVAVVDIVGLRDVNDTFGFEGGDRVLVEFSRRLQAPVGERTLAGRIGGDEFTVFVQPAAGETLETRMDRLLECLSASLELDGVEIKIAVRLGFTRMGAQLRPPEILLGEAKRALFQHRAMPLLPWVAYSSGLADEARERIELTREMHAALTADQFELHFHPQVDLASGSLVSSEALLRWNHPEKGLISPSLFIPIAEQSQLIGLIGDWVLRRACEHLREWRDAGLNPVRVSVNVSLVQFQMNDFADRVRALLKTFGVAPAALALEITESVFERESELLLNQLLTLHKMGVWLSLDDFGTGYSSLTYLQRYPFDEIKIDQSFVFRLLEDSFSRHVVETVVSLARALKAVAVAEGIESAAIGDELQAMGCRLGQGYFYSMPLEAEDFRWLLQQRSPLPLAARKAP